jgi:hypothetical protein
MEEYKKIEDYEHYEVSNMGRIRNTNTGRYLKHGSNPAGYSNVILCEQGKKKKGFTVHRLVASHFLPNVNQKAFIDHIDGDKKNNKCSNLRWCTGGENRANIGKLKNNKSGYKGVAYHKRNKKFIAKICINKRNIHLGYYLTAEEAYNAYCKKALELTGEFCRL